MHASLLWSTAAKEYNTPPPVWIIRARQHMQSRIWTGNRPIEAVALRHGCCERRQDNTHSECDVFGLTPDTRQNTPRRALQHVGLHRTVPLWQRLATPPLTVTETGYVARQSTRPWILACAFRWPYCCSFASVSTLKPNSCSRYI